MGKDGKIGYGIGRKMIKLNVEVIQNRVYERRKGKAYATGDMIQED